MKAHEVLSAALKGLRKGVAYACRVSPGLVDQWCHQHTQDGGDGCHGPHERVVRVVDYLDSQGSDGGTQILDWILSSTGRLPSARMPVGQGVLFADIATVCVRHGETYTKWGQIWMDQILYRRELLEFRGTVCASIAEESRLVAAIDRLLVEVDPNKKAASVIQTPAAGVEVSLR